MSTDHSSTPNSPLRLRSSSPEGTESIGFLLGEHLRTSPLFVTLEGTLGAGKTALTRGIVEGVTPGEGDFVSSPTYAVCNVYPTEPPIYHYDLYRLMSEDDLESVGFYDSLERGILIVEWPQKVKSVLERSDLKISLRTIDHASREIEVRASSERGLHLLKTWAAEPHLDMLEDVVRLDAKIKD